MKRDSLSLIFSPAHRQHDPIGQADAPLRAEELRQAALDFGAQERGPGDFGMEPIVAVHSPELLALLQTRPSRRPSQRHGKLFLSNGAMLQLARLFRMALKYLPQRKQTLLP